MPALYSWEFASRGCGPAPPVAPPAIAEGLLTEEGLSLLLEDSSPILLE